MFGTEIKEHDSKETIEKNGISEITTNALSLEDAKKYWDKTFDDECEWLSEEELWDAIIGCDGSEFSFYDVVDDRTKEVLEHFNTDTWETLDTDKRLELIEKLAICIGESLEIENLPEIELVKAEDSCYGFYNERGNYIVLNTNYWDNEEDVVDTIAHEIRHAYQRERADKLENSQDQLYKFNFEHYIAPEDDELGYCVNFCDYYFQYIEVEARAFASEFKAEVA